MKENVRLKLEGVLTIASLPRIDNLFAHCQHSTAVVEPFKYLNFHLFSLFLVFLLVLCTRSRGITKYLDVFGFSFKLSVYIYINLKRRIFFFR